MRYHQVHAHHPGYRQRRAPCRKGASQAREKDARRDHLRAGEARIDGASAATILVEQGAQGRSGLSPLRIAGRVGHQRRDRQTAGRRCVLTSARHVDLRPPAFAGLDRRRPPRALLARCQRAHRVARPRSCFPRERDVVVGQAWPRRMGVLPHHSEWMHSHHVEPGVSQFAACSCRSGTPGGGLCRARARVLARRSQRAGWRRSRSSENPRPSTADRPLFARHGGRASRETRHVRHDNPPRCGKGRESPASPGALRRAGIRDSDPAKLH